MNYKLILFATTFLLLSCNEEQYDSLKSFIPGGYERSVQNEFSIGSDTLIIYQTGNNTYTIEHLLSYQRIIDGKKLNLERKTEKWLAVFDEKNGVLTEAKRGRVLSFQPEQNKLLVGGSSYQKINK